jgi:hypothetical protein
MRKVASVKWDERPPEEIIQVAAKGGGGREGRMGIGEMSYREP